MNNKLSFYSDDVIKLIAIRACTLYGSEFEFDCVSFSTAYRLVTSMISPLEDLVVKLILCGKDWAVYNGQIWRLRF